MINTSSDRPLQEKIGRWNRATFDYSIGFLLVMGLVMAATFRTQWQMMGATVGILGMWIDLAWLLTPHGLWREGSAFSTAWYAYDRSAGYRSLLNRLIKPALWGDYVTHLPFHAHAAAQNGNHVRVITRNCTLPRRSPARRTKRASGAATKAGDDGDGGDDGEPPRPRSAHSPTPHHHHNLTRSHSLTIAGGAQ